jgi:hypothetical protein
MPYYKTIDEFLTDAQVALNAAFGYTSDRIQEG